MRSPKPCWRSDAASWKPAWPAPTITTAPCAIRSGRYDAKRQGVEPAKVGILAKYGPLLGVAGKAVQRVAEPVDRGVDAGGKKGAHQHARFVFRQFARIDGLKNLHA